MNIDPLDPYRRFEVGIAGSSISHVANIRLDSDSQITFLSPESLEYDVVRKEWGYYATPSLNGRLRANGMRAALVRSRDTGLLFVVLVEVKQELLWRDYNQRERQEFLCWLDEMLPVVP